MKQTIKEILVVEGKMDVVAIKKAVDADCLVTHGFGLSARCLNDIQVAYEKRGIIILTDPDRAGERIRKFLTEKFPNAKHAFIPREEATANHDIGVEQAKPEAILKALSKVRTLMSERKKIFTSEDLFLHGLNGTAQANHKRDKLGAILGIGYANAKTFLNRLNLYGVTREEFLQAIKLLGSD